jgi:hypothetical protein
MNIEKLVADRELCERIPAGEFLDTAFCWHYTEFAGFVCGNGCKQFSGKQWMLERSTSGKIVRYRQRGEQIFPAPTLQEIMQELPSSNIYRIRHMWTANLINDSVDNGVKSTNPATAALKLLLEVNGK